MMRDGLYQVTRGPVCAGFVVEGGRVTLQAPILRARGMGGEVRRVDEFLPGGGDLMNERICSLPDCTHPHRAKGYCVMHYKRWTKYGDPNLGARGARPIKAGRYKWVCAPGHLLSHPDGRVYLHRMVLFNKIGPGSHQCYWCGLMVTWRAGRLQPDSLVTDHLDHNRVNNDPDNLVPSCNACNGHRNPGEIWTPWVEGDPIGVKDLSQSTCRKGLHLMTPDNVFIRTSDGSRSCGQCRQLQPSRSPQRNRDYRVAAKYRKIRLGER